MSVHMQLKTVISKTVTTAGTAEALASSVTYAKRVTIQAGKAGGANTGDIYLGDSTVDKTSNRCLAMATGDVYNPPIDSGDRIDLADIYIDAANSGDGVKILYWD